MSIPCGGHALLSFHHSSINISFFFSLLIFLTTICLYVPLNSQINFLFLWVCIMIHNCVPFLNFTDLQIWMIYFISVIFLTLLTLSHLLPKMLTLFCGGFRPGNLGHAVKYVHLLVLKKGRSEHAHIPNIQHFKYFHYFEFPSRELSQGCSYENSFLHCKHCHIASHMNIFILCFQVPICKSSF